MTALSTNPNRLTLDEAYMRMAEVWALRSKAVRKQVGAIIVKNRQIISDGYNGMPAGSSDEVCEMINPDGSISSKPQVLHAESNALMKLSRNGGQGCADATLYITLSPCLECAKLIAQAGIIRVVYRDLYRDQSGLAFLAERNIQVDSVS